ncbi:MAG: LysE family translocator [Alphaproteobacteria bacterium]|nr:LysE family translocator [Alphaproteobacteria bacterium]
MSGLPLDPALYAGYLATAIAIVVSPGPDTLFILRAALASGRSAGLAAVTGVQSGVVVHVALAAAGISAVLAAAPFIFQAIAIAGALWLGKMGLDAIRDGGTLFGLGTPRAIGRARAYWQAAATNLLNPKVLLLFLALFPNFVAPSLGRVWLQVLLLGATLLVVNILWQTFLVLAADWVRRRLESPKAMRAISLATGAIFLGFALLLLVDHVLPVLRG